MPAARSPKAVAANSAGPSLTRPQRLAALLVMLGPDAAAPVLAGLDPRDARRIATEMVNLPKLGPVVEEEILREFSGVMEKSEGSAGSARPTTRSDRAGGMDGPGRPQTDREPPAGSSRALDTYDSSEVFKTAEPAEAPHLHGARQLAELEPRQMFALLRTEQTQTIALVLSHLPPEKAGEALALFAPEQRDKILERVATLAPTPVAVIQKVCEVLLARCESLAPCAVSQTGGLRTVADVLDCMNKVQGSTALGSLEERNPKLGEAIRRKMIEFEDLAALDSAARQRLMQTVDARELALALKRNASESLKAALLSVLSARGAEALEKEGRLLGPVSLKAIEGAQLRITALARRLEEEGAIDFNETQEGRYALA